MDYERPESKKISFNLDKISKSEKKHLKRYCEMIYQDEYKNYMNWLPESIYDVTDEHITNMATIEFLLHVKIIAPFLQLRKSALEIKKRLP